MSLRTGFLATISVAAVSVLGAAPASAMGGAVHYSADYRISADGETHAMTMYSSPTKMRIDVDAGEGDGANIIDRNTMESVTLVDMGDMKMAMKIDGAGLLSQMNMDVPEQGSLPASTGTKTVAGHSCKTYRVEGSDICMTSDGILLEALSPDGNMVATRLERGVQPASLFEIPAGYQVMDMNSMMGGMMPNMGGMFGDE